MFPQLGIRSFTFVVKPSRNHPATLYLITLRWYAVA